MKPAEFKNPGKEYRPSPFWSWNDALDPEELRWQVRQMAEQGFGGYFMHSRVGLATPYLSKEWMECIRACLEEGRKVDTESWLYDEDKWPSGFAGGIIPAKGDEYKARALIAEEVESPDENALRCFAIKMSESGKLKSFRQVDTSSKIDEDETVYAFHVRIQPPSNWFNGESYVDLLNPMVTEEFMKATHDAYAEEFKGEFGEFMPGMFTDEPQYYIGGQAPWTDAMPEYFQQINGYDLLEKLPLVYFEGEGSEKVRYDFWRTVTQRFVEAFSKPFGERCEKLNLMMTGHYMAEDNLVYQIHFIGAAMPHYEFMQCPGIDHLGRNIDNPLTLKQCSSAAHQFGRPRILCEIFGVSGHSMTFEDQKWIADFHFALGITFLCQHLTLYTMKGEQKRDYPPTISYHQPYWGHYKLANDYFSRAGYLCSQGQFYADILLLHPMGSAWATYEPLANRNERAESYNRSFTTLLDDLLAIHRDFDLGDEMILSKHASVDGNTLRVAKEGRYRLIVVPPSLTWSRSTFELLKSFMAAGGPVVFVGETPTLIDGVPAESEWQELLQHKGVTTVAADKTSVEQALDKFIPHDVSITDADGNEIGDIYVHHRIAPSLLKGTGGISGENHIYFLSSKSRTESYKARISLAITPPLAKGAGGISGKVTEWHLASGEITDVPVKVEDGRAIVELEFPPVGSHALVVDTAAEIETPATHGELAVKETIALNGPWMFERLHLNSLTLDTCQYALDDGDWSDKTPIWKARRAAWKAAGLEAYAGIQPWALDQKGIKPTAGLKLRLKTTFESEVEGKNVSLVLESASDYTLSVNGQAVSTETDEWHWDKQFSKVDISEQVKKGENLIELECQYGMDVQVEDMYLIGDFGVRKVADDKYILTDEPQKLTNGNWGEQGYPFYAGNIRYRGKFTCEAEDGQQALLRLKNPKGCLFRISVNDSEPILLWYQPWQVDITDFVKHGENSVSIEVISTLRNTFGPLHHKLGDALPWVGPGQFVDEANWVDDYQLVPYGLIDGIEIVVSE
ncbi:TPA: hypothetical protein EYP66_19325 [Candidatus Poribacteria bacterium]|nr:hypothetical protein [Candidatus Poribacteria bacterium]